MTEQYTISISATRQALNLLKYEGEDILKIPRKIQRKINWVITDHYVKLIQFDEIEFVINLKTESEVYEYEKQLWSKEMIINRMEELCKQNN